MLNLIIDMDVPNDENAIDTMITQLQKIMDSIREGGNIGGEHDTGYLYGWSLEDKRD